MFYVYEWYIKDTDEIFYVGKGSKKRYLCNQHNALFKEFIKRYNCSSRIYKTYKDEQQAYQGEFDRINELKAQGQCVCNMHIGGSGGGASIKTPMHRWTEEQRQKYSINNVMKCQAQRERMSKNNPMKNKEYASKNGLLHRKPFFIGDKEFQTQKEAAVYFGISQESISDALRRGSRKGQRCYYKYGNQQPSTNLND